MLSGKFRTTEGMNSARPWYYRRVRLFCELKIHAVSSATGISASRLQAIETGRRLPNAVERRILERFLQDKLRMVVAMDGPIPVWLRGPSASLAEEGEA